MHFLWGAFAVSCIYPLIHDRERIAIKKKWSSQLLGILGIRIDANMSGIVPGCLIVANHISWLDIYALNAVRPVAFVSKAEVRGWPLVGWLAQNADTVFLRRESHRHARVVNCEIKQLLCANKDVAIFPEGTTTDGSHLLKFNAALLQSAVDAGRAVQPVALSYHQADGQPSLAPAYFGDITMGECFAAILASRSLIVRLRSTPPLDPQTRTRRELAQAARSAIAFNLGLPIKSSEMGETIGEFAYEVHQSDLPSCGTNRVTTA